MMTRTLVAALLLAVAPAPAIAAETRFTTPESAGEVLEPKDLPVALRYDEEQWAIAPQRSNFRLLARVTHKSAPVSGAFVYRDQPSSEGAVRERARNELDTAFADFEIGGFEQRRVNGVPVMFMRARATTPEGDQVRVLSYYWLGPDSVIDYSLVVRDAAFDDRRQDIIDLLNGLEIASSGN
jgi:hypothetical protein